MLKTRFYKYYFIGLEKPIIMEAESKHIADKMLDDLQYKSKTVIDLTKLIDVRVETPIIGISTRKRNSLEYVWVGKEFTSSGWLEKKEYDRLNNI